MKLAEIPVRKEQIAFTGVLKLLLKTIWLHYPWPLIGVLITGVISGIFQLAAPKILQKIIDQLTSSVFMLQEYWLLIILASLSLFLAALFKFFSEKLSFYVATQVEDRWRFTATLNFYDLPLRWHDQHDSGEIASKIERGGGAIWIVLYEIFGQNLIVSVITLLFVLIYILWSFPSFVPIFLIPIPIYIAVTVIISKRINILQEKLNVLDHVASSAFYDGVGNVRYVKTFGKETAETAHYAVKWSAYHHLEYKLHRIWLWQGFLQKIIEAATRAAVLLFAILAVRAGTLTIGEVVLLVSLQYLTFVPLEQLNQLFTRLRRVTKRASHLFKIAAEEDQLADAEDAVLLTSLQNQIRFDHVSFEYSKKLQTLNDISFTLAANTTTAIVGRSGAGKTTLAMLLLRFYDPDKGRILWDGIDIRQAKRASLRSKATLILQDTTLFNRGIAANIAYGKPGASMKEIEAAAKLAHAHEFILKLPKGYQSVVGERGVRLSGGQRQRIAIARALLIKPELLVMDEATSHLDSETELAIKEAIQYLQGKNTQVIIAHRLSTVQHADNIILLDKGKIVAQETHQKLLENPLYRKLCQLQLQK